MEQLVDSRVLAKELKISNHSRWQKTTLKNNLGLGFSDYQKEKTGGRPRIVTKLTFNQIIIFLQKRYRESKSYIVDAIKKGFAPIAEKIKKVVQKSSVNKKGGFGKKEEESYSDNVNINYRILLKKEIIEILHDRDLCIKMTSLYNEPLNGVQIDDIYEYCVKKSRENYWKMFRVAM